MAVGEPVPLDTKYLAVCAELAMDHEMSVKAVVQAAIRLYQLTSYASREGYRIRFINNAGEDMEEPVGLGLVE